MKFHKLFGVSLLGLASACAVDVNEQGELEGEGELGTSEQAIVNSWIGPVSEEAPGNSATCAQANVGITQAQCTGKYCDNNSLWCAALPAGVTSIGSGFYTQYISEESPNNQVFCDSNGGTNPTGIMDGIRATGKYSDNLSIHCREVNVPPVSCSWTTWLSEENGGLLDFGAGKFAVGMRCSGAYCDNVSYRVCSF